MPVKLASNLELPNNAVTQTFAFIARKGAGKTHNAGKLVEGLLLIGAPVIILDPVGTWYGLRLNASGKSSSGFNIPVFGGQNGDIPIDVTQGELLGRLVVERNLSGVIDVSSFRKNERKRFVTEFAEALFHHSKASRAPRMLVLEEAQLFAPQRSQGEERMLGAIEDIVRLGRNYGIGSTMISQRPQSINKEVLNQVECLFVGQLNAAHERKAVEEWVAEHKASKDWTKELPSLPVGTMIVWSPQWLGVMQKVKILKKATFDASATPELGDKAVRVKPPEFDVEALRLALAPPASTTKTREIPASTREDKQLESQLEAARAAAGRERAVFVQTLAQLSTELGKVALELQELERRIKEHPAMLGTLPARNFFLNERQELPKEPKLARLRAVKPRDQLGLTLDRRSMELEVAAGLEELAADPGKPVEHLKSGARRMIELLAAFHPGHMTKAQIAKAADMKVTGGTFGAYWSALNREGLILRVGVDSYKATERALKYLGKDRFQMPDDLGARVLFWEERLKAGEITMLRNVVHAGDRGISRATLAESCSMTMSGGTFGAYLGTLVRNRLVTKDGDLLKIHPWLAGEE